MTRNQEWDAVYGTGAVQAESRYLTLPVAALDPWQEDGHTQPFKPYAPDALQKLADNIRENGLMEPILVRPKAGGRFEIIAGHNRVEACKLAGIATVKAVCQEMDDAEAAQRLVDSNLMHRETILPSELGFAYKLRLEAMERRKGRPKKESQVETNFAEGRNVDVLAAELKVSPAQIYRYIHITALIPFFIERVDDKRVPMAVAGKLAARDAEQQTMLAKVMTECGKDRLTAKDMAAIISLWPWSEDWIRQQLTKEPQSAATVKVTLALDPADIGLNHEQLRALEKDPKYQMALMVAVRDVSRRHAQEKGLLEQGA